MAQAGLHAYIALSLRKKTPQVKWFLFAFVMGAIIPDLDIILTAIFSIFLTINESIILTHQTFSHSIFTHIIIYILFLIIYEATNREKFLHIGNGIFLGLLSHLLVDIFLWFDSIHLFWPLPTDRLTIWGFIGEVKPLYIKILLALEFVFFRLLAYEIIKIILSYPSKNGKYIKNLSKYMQFQILFLIIFSFMSYFLNTSYTYFIFGLMYIPSLTIITFYLYKSKNSFNGIHLKKETLDDNDSEHIKSAIHNIE